jgi:hypothetical protein
MPLADESPADTVHPDVDNNSTESQPYSKRYQPHECARVLAPEELPVKPQHSMMLVPLYEYWS